METFNNGSYHIGHDTPPAHNPKTKNRVTVAKSRRRERLGRLRRPRPRGLSSGEHSATACQSQSSRWKCSVAVLPLPLSWSVISALEKAKSTMPMATAFHRIDGHGGKGLRWVGSAPCMWTHVGLSQSSELLRKAIGKELLCLCQAIANLGATCASYSPAP